MLSKNKKEKIIKGAHRHDSDTGSPEVQVSLLTERIKSLSQHLKKNRKDKHSRRGLLGMVSDRRKHLAYLKKKDPTRYAEVAAKIKE